MNSSLAAAHSGARNASRSYNFRRVRAHWMAIALCAGWLSACGSGDPGAPTPNEPPPAPPPVTATDAPQVYYTDIVSGPTTGGENNKGIYLSIFGKNFGSGGLGATLKVYIGNAEVDNYRYLGASKGRSDIQQITVQVGALGSPTPGVALPIKVVVGNTPSNTDQRFTPNPGRILFVDNVAGNDGTAVIGDITKPYRHVQTPTLAAAAWGWRPTTTVIRPSAHSRLAARLASSSVTASTSALRLSM